ncbi:MAG: Protein tyrosine/serine phosphatase [candidate division TM6 bacterium GW2011_GWF2_38_10]|nr:MAG: Protein tyrosine/serine phosphatase [candidate division TM6 bacterium GW2011_GWF2_38_10]
MKAGIREAVFMFVILTSGCTRRPTQHPRVPRLTRMLHNFHAVEPGVLYRSSQLSASMLSTIIKKYGIKTIVNLRGRNEHKAWWQTEQTIAQTHKVTFINIPMSAQHLPQKQHLITLLETYNTAPRPMLIHCYSGSDRTGEAAALWVLEQQKKGKHSALKQLSLRYGHIPRVYPAKRFFIKLWQGIPWLNNEYDPLDYTP